MRSLPVAATIVLAVVCPLAAMAQDQPSASRVRTFTYKRAEQGELKIHVHTPEGWKAGDKRPAIVFFFGGGWKQGNVRQFARQAEYLAERGMVAARADYRVRARHQVAPDKCVEDARSGVRWMRQHAAELGVDPDRIVASGGSAGGHIAACTGCTPGPEAEGEDLSVSARPNAMVLFNPVLKFQGIPRLTRLVGDDETLAKLLSPTLHLAKDTPPALLLFGTKDRLLPHGEEFIARSKEVGNRAELYTAEDMGHGFFNRPPWRQKTLHRVDEFLSSLGYLEGEPTIELP